MSVDEAGFAREREDQKQRARASWKGESRRKEKEVYGEFRDLKVRSCVHEKAEMADVRVLGLVKDGRRTDILRAGESGEVILEETPFYAEAGGQVGDTGSLKGALASALVENVTYATPEVIVHVVKVLSGTLAEGDRVDAAPDLVRRQAVSNNHTATHLLHAALRQVLGDHVKQAGSLVSPERLRFDFTHFAALTREEVRRVEEIVNARVRADLPLETRVTSLDEGIREGAMAIFEEKYGESVRVVGIGDFSKELCGGVHVRATGQIGLFKIVAETSVAAGMRRIEAVTGEGAYRYVRELEDLLAGMEKGLGVGRKDIPARIEKLQGRIEELEKDARGLRKKMLAGSVEAGSSAGAAPAVRTVKGVSVEVRRLDGLTMPELRDTADQLKNKLGSGVVVIGGVSAGKAFIVASVTKDLAGRIQAGALIKELAPVIGGGGGGRPDFAQSGGPGTAELDKALELVPGLVERLAP
jgi:alanyl-tRNA synthetase